MSKYTIINDIGKFKDLKSCWGSLFDRVEGASVFQSYDWNYEWCNYYKNISSKKLFIILYYNRKPEEIYALFPLFIDQNATLRFIADSHTDYCDFLIDYTACNPYKIFKIFAGIVHDSHYHIKSIKFENIKQTSNSLSFLSYVFDAKQLMLQTNASSRISLIPCDDSFPKNLVHLKSSQRSELKRIIKKNCNYRQKIYTAAYDKFPNDEIIEMVREMKSSGLRNENFLTSGMIDTIIHLYAANRVIVNGIFKDDQIVAVNIILVNKKTYIFWLDMYRNISLINLYGYLVFMHKMSENLKNNSVEIDLGRGLYNYKIHNFQPDIVPLFSFLYSNNSLCYCWNMTLFYVKYLLKPIYSKYKLTINRILGR